MSEVAARVSLHDVAPRLARARDLNRLERSHVDEPAIGIRLGDRFETILNYEYGTARCSCGGTRDVYVYASRLEAGCNRGRVETLYWAKCRRCGRSCGGNLRPRERFAQLTGRWPRYLRTAGVS